MRKADRKAMQDKGDAEIRRGREGKPLILKRDSLNERARKLEIATDMPSINREQRRRSLREAVASREKGEKG